MGEVALEMGVTRTEFEHTRDRGMTHKKQFHPRVFVTHIIYILGAVNRGIITAAADTLYFVLFLISRTSYGVSVGESGDGRSTRRRPPSRVFAGSHGDEIAPALPTRISQCVRDRVQ